MSTQTWSSRASSASSASTGLSPATGPQRANSAGEKLAPGKRLGPQRPETLRQAAPATAVMRQRKKVKPFRPGDMVEIYSLQHKQWILDGEVVEAVSETCRDGDAEVLAGSIKVVFKNATFFQWVALQQMEEYVRPSLRPKPPKPIAGVLQKQTHCLFPYWHERYVEVNKGFMLWWENEEQARSGEPAKGSFYLLGLRLDRKYAAGFSVGAETTPGIAYYFSTDSEEKTAEWAESISMHSDYCEDTRPRDWPKAAKAMEECGEASEEMLRALGVDVVSASIFSTA